MKNIFDLYKIGEKKSEGLKNTYVFNVECDANDGDYMYEKFEMPAEDFKNDLLFQYVVAYVGKGYSGKYGDSWNDAQYGHHIASNKHFDWLFDYCTEAGLLAFCGACDNFCHSITSVDVVYFDENGDKHDIEIPDFDELFDTIEEAQEEMTTLYEEDYAD